MRMDCMIEKRNSPELELMSADQFEHGECSVEASLFQMATRLMYQQREIVEEPMRMECAIEKSESAEVEPMSAEQFKEEECSVEASLSQMATELVYHQRDMVEEPTRMECMVEKSNSLQVEITAAEQFKHEECSGEASLFQTPTELMYYQRDIVEKPTRMERKTEKSESAEIEPMSAEQSKDEEYSVEASLFQMATELIYQQRDIVEEAMGMEILVEKSNSPQVELMVAEQFKPEECSVEASSFQMTNELKYHWRDVAAAHILVQMASENFSLLFHRSGLLGMTGKPKRRRKKKSNKIGGHDDPSEVARKTAKFVAKRQRAVRGPINSADSVVLALSAVSCSRKRKNKRMNNLCEAGGLFDGHELTKRCGNKSIHQKPLETCIEEHHDRLDVLREEKVDVASPVNIPRLLENDVREENDNDLHEILQFSDRHETPADIRGNNDQKGVGAAVEYRHGRLGMSSIRKKKKCDRILPEKTSRKCCSGSENALRTAGTTIDRLHSDGNPPAPSVILMTPNLYDSKRPAGVVRRRNITTINPSSEEVRAYFHKEESLRYLVPDRVFFYTAVDGRKSAVAPLRKRSKVRLDHDVLKADKPWIVCINCLVRDAAARLPGGIGTRADICTLMRDSQYLMKDVTDEQLNHFSSKALDRLHYEVDPCVKYDGKVWVYLHRNRVEEDFKY